VRTSVLSTISLGPSVLLSI